MGKDTKIAWADHTFNPWWGCTKLSEACRNCYAVSTANRFAGTLWGPLGRRRFFGDNHWKQPERWNRAAAQAGVRARVFCASMGDVFEQLPQDHPDIDAMVLARQRLRKLITDTPHLDWLLLTKRPELMGAFGHEWWHDTPNAWAGTTVEDQDSAERRIPHLLNVPAHKRFISCEPLLEHVWLQEPWLGPGADQIHWVICGGESGADARPMELDWARSLRAQCAIALVPFLFKQLGSKLAATSDASTPKGTALEDAPKDLRIREVLS